MRTAIVNGSTGSIGLALTEALLKKGIRTFAITFPGDKREELLPVGVDIIHCDMREIQSLPGLIQEKVDAFFHLAWMGTIGPGRDDMLLQTENIRCALNAVSAAKECGCGVFLGVGSQAEHGRVSDGIIKPDTPCFPTNGYGIAKLCAGQMTRVLAHQLTMRHVWTRILSVYGPNDSPLSVTSVIIDKLLKGEKPALTAGEQLWDYLYIDDAAEALILMAERGKDGAVYPLGSGEVKPLRDYFETMRDAVDPQLPLGIGELPYPQNQVMRMQACIEELTKDTGFVPKVDFSTGIKEVVQIKKMYAHNNV